MLYSAFDHTNVSLYHFDITNNEPQEIDIHFGENNLITFHGIGVVDIMLYLFSCANILNNKMENLTPMQWISNSL